MGYQEPDDCWLHHAIVLKEEYKGDEDLKYFPEIGTVSADLLDPDVFCILKEDGFLVRMFQEHKKFYNKGQFLEEIREDINSIAEEKIESKSERFNDEELDSENE